MPAPNAQPIPNTTRDAVKREAMKLLVRLKAARTRFRIRNATTVETATTTDPEEARRGRTPESDG